MKNILIVSNNDMCRSRMAQEILNSFGRGMKISTAGILAGNSDRKSTRLNSSHTDSSRMPSSA